MNDETRLVLAGLQGEIEKHLEAIVEMLPDDYAVTLIARNTKIPNAQLVVTKETDIETVANELLGAPKL